MKRRLAALFLTAMPAFSQGLVHFSNTPTTLVSAGPKGQEAVISGAPGSYYFGLLTAYGTTDPGQFTFSGLYATNLTTPGLFSLPGVAAVPGWPLGTVRSVLVAGWSASLGHGWNQQWLNGDFGAFGYFGLSSIATGIPGGSGGGVPSPPLDIFGDSMIQTGWNLFPVPEPSTIMVAALGGATWILRRRARTEKPRSPQKK